MILATKSGWLILVKLVEKREKQTIVKAVDDGHVFKIRKSDPTRKVFAGTQEAINWITEPTK
jgi:hypothetical protein